MEGKHRRRKFRSFFINKNIQLKIAITNLIYMILVITIVILAVLAPYYFDIFQESELCRQYLSAKLFIVLLERLVIAVVGLSVVAFIHQIVITHKFCGPLVNFGNSFEKVAKDKSFISMMKKMQMPIVYLPPAEFKEKCAKLQAFFPGFVKSMGLLRK